MNDGTRDATNDNDTGLPKVGRKEYGKQLALLQAELVRVQEWVVREGLKVLIVFEGRDGAGKGGVIKRITERVSPRVFRVVALPAPSGPRHVRSRSAGRRRPTGPLARPRSRGGPGLSPPARARPLSCPGSHRVATVNALRGPERRPR